MAVKRPTTVSKGTRLAGGAAERGGGRLAARPAGTASGRPADGAPRDASRAASRATSRNTTSKTSRNAARNTSRTASVNAAGRTVGKASAAGAPLPAERIRREILDLEPLDRLAGVFASLGSPSRLRLLYLLYHRSDLRVGELADLTGLTISGVSMHLRRLKEAGLVACRRDRQSMCCALPAHGDHVLFLGQLFEQISRETGCCCLPENG